jgi:hypothetical protein
VSESAPRRSDSIVHIVKLISTRVSLHALTLPLLLCPCRGNLPQSYRRKVVPLALTKSTPATDGKVKPLALFKTPQTAAAAAAGGEQGMYGPAAAADPGAAWT